MTATPSVTQARRPEHGDSVTDDDLEGANVPALIASGPGRSETENSRKADKERRRLMAVFSE